MGGMKGGDQAFRNGIDSRCDAAPQPAKDLSLRDTPTDDGEFVNKKPHFNGTAVFDGRSVVHGYLLCASLTFTGDGWQSFNLETLRLPFILRSILDPLTSGFTLVAKDGQFRDIMPRTRRQTLHMVKGRSSLLTNWV